MASKLKPKTEKEVNAEIAKLLEIKPKVRRFSMFGNDHWKQIDIQLRVLREEIDDDDISGIADPDDNSAAYETLQWMEGRDVDASPADQWEGLWKPDPTP